MDECAATTQQQALPVDFIADGIFFRETSNDISNFEVRMRRTGCERETMMKFDFVFEMLSTSVYRAMLIAWLEMFALRSVSPQIRAVSI